MFRRTVAILAMLAAVAAGGARAVTPSDPLAATWAYGAINLPAAWDVTAGSERASAAC